jgi:hypothetical protein
VTFDEHDTHDRTHVSRRSHDRRWRLYRPPPVSDPLLMDFDPFLLLDEMGPIDYAPGEAKARRIIRIAASKQSRTRSRANSATRIRRAIRARCAPATCNG